MQYFNVGAQNRREDFGKTRIIRDTSKVIVNNPVKSYKMAADRVSRVRYTKYGCSARGGNNRA
jgi:hypothetical protein